MRQKKKISMSPYDLYLHTLSTPELAALSSFWEEVGSHCTLSKKEKLRLRADYESALLAFAALGVPVGAALERMGVRHLGGFYARPAILWYPLDDAAKIYPLSMKQGQMAVFRLSVYFKEDVVPALLQMALTFTIKRFPSFATTVKKGFFWHYLDTAKRRFVIEPDTGYPCRPLKVGRSGSQSFRVMYFHKRVSIEFFHILTDGTGGMVFLKALTAEYLRLLGVELAEPGSVPDLDAVPDAEETANEFDRADQTEKSAGFMEKSALQMSGSLSRARPYRVLHFKMDSDALKAAAKGKSSTVTSYLLSQLFLAGRYATDELQGEMSIQVPVNMRKFYPSKTVRNFAMYCGVRLPLQSITKAEDILPEISRQLEKKASRQAMSEMMNATRKMVGALRFIPLFIKAPAARMVYGFLGDKIFSNTLSNLGVVQLSAPLDGYIDSMDFVLGTALTNRAGCSLVTFGHTATLSIAKMTADPSFEERLYDLLQADGIDITVEGSAPCED